MLWIESKLIYGNYTNAIRGNCRLPTHATRQRQPKQSGCVKRRFVCSRTGLQMARPAQAFWQLAHDLHSNESLEQEWRARPFVPEVAAIADCAHQDRGCIVGQHHGESSSRRHRSVKKTRAKLSGNLAAADQQRFICLPAMFEREKRSGFCMGKGLIHMRDASC